MRAIYRLKGVLGCGTGTFGVQGVEGGSLDDFLALLKHFSDVALKEEKVGRKVVTHQILRIYAYYHHINAIHNLPPLTLIVDCCVGMEVQELAQLKIKKHNLQKRREVLIRNELKKRHKAKVNLDQSAVKQGRIEKTKYIAKKIYETKVEKTKKAPIKLQDNVNPNTFLTRNGDTNKAITRTQQRVQFDSDTLERGVKAVNAYAIANREKNINVTLEFEKEIQCEPWPFLV